jgi:UDP-N-acetylmuramoyl-L-alanyl-D-glutamate--2,6-diaminopimelate ligase
MTKSGQPPLSRAATLAELLLRATRRGLAAELRRGSGNVPVSGVRVDSRLVAPGDVFVAMPGTRVDGAAFVAEAVRRGAVAVVCDRAHEDRIAQTCAEACKGPLAGAAAASSASERENRETTRVALVVVEDAAAAAGYLASAACADPSDSLELVGITGTNGKTSCTWLLEAVWKRAGGEPGVLGTIAQRCRAFERVSSMTTPSAVDLQAVLAEMQGAGCDRVAMEVSSHALEQRRVAGCRFRAALFTNLTRDHLDYHDTEERYFAAKASLFRDWLDPVAGSAVLNADDPMVAALAAELAHLDVWTYSTEGAPAARARVISAECTLAGITAVFDVGGTRVDVRSPLVGTANLSNLLSVAALARALHVDAGAIAAALSSCPPIPGRMERVSPAKPAVFVDYAHTPDALERSLASLVPETRGRIVVVFGCGGDRDRGKRPIMGRIAAGLAQVAVLTSDNPRSEEPEAILREIEGGIGARMAPASIASLAGQGGGGYLVEVDRRAAIETAIRIAAEDDVILVAGKGHEDYQETKGVRRSFDDRAIARAALSARGRAGDAG